MNLQVKKQIVHERGALLAKMFLEELQPLFLSRPSSDDLGYDFLVGFKNDKSGVNTFAVQVRVTERPPGHCFTISRDIFERATHSNVPALLLVVDAKQNRHYYAWLASGTSGVAAQAVAVPIIEVTDASKRHLVKQLKKAEVREMAAG